MDITSSLDSCSLVNEGVAIDTKGPVAIAGIRDRRGRDTTKRSGSFGTSAPAAGTNCPVFCLLVASISTICAVWGVVRPTVPIAVLGAAVILVILVLVVSSIPNVGISSVGIPSVGVCISSITIISVIVVVAVVTIALGNSEADTIILSTSLGNGHQYGLMVGGRRHGAKTVVTSR